MEPNVSGLLCQEPFHKGYKLDLDACVRAVWAPCQGETDLFCLLLLLSGLGQWICFLLLWPLIHFALRKFHYTPTHPRISAKESVPIYSLKLPLRDAAPVSCRHPNGWPSPCSSILSISLISNLKSRTGETALQLRALAVQ